MIQSSARTIKHFSQLYRVTVDLNLNALKSFWFAFTPKRYTLSSPLLHINTIPHSYVDAGLVFSKF